MRPDPRKYLWDALNAAELLGQFTAGKTFGDYQDDILLRSAVERQFEIVGEALSQPAKINAEIAQQVPELPRIVAFRNILIHGYANVDDTLVWQLLTGKLPQPQIVLQSLLAMPVDDAEPPGASSTHEESKS